MDNFKRKATIILICALTLGSSSVVAQVFKGDKHYEKHDYVRALMSYEKAYTENFSNAYLTRKIANSYRKLGDVETSLVWFKRTLEMDQSNKTDMLYYAEALKTIENYGESQKWYKYYNKMKPDDSRALSHLRDDEYFISLKRDSAKYGMTKLLMSSDKPEFGIARFGDKLLFSSAGVENPGERTKHEINPYMDIYEATPDGLGQLNDIKKLKNVNSKFHDGPVWFDEANQELYITRNNEKNGKPVLDSQGRVNLKIYRSKLVNDEWQKAEELSLNSNEYSNAHPTLTPDGNTLFFSSNRPGGTGGNDVYMCKRVGDGWSTAVNVGRPINTEGNEVFPTVGADGKLYFASDGHVGLGALDIFYTENEGGLWSLPKNLGYPINSHKDDFGLLPTKDRKHGYFSSNRDAQKVQDDIFYYSIKNTLRIRAGVNKNTALYGTDDYILRMYDEDGKFVGMFMNEIDGMQTLEMDRKNGKYRIEFESGSWEAEPIEIVIDDTVSNELVLDNIVAKAKGLAVLPTNLNYFSGTVTDRETASGIKDYQVSIYNAATGDEVAKQNTTDEGELAFPYEVGNAYKVIFEKDGWPSREIMLNTAAEGGEININDKHDLAFTKIALGKALDVENIYYDFDKHNIRQDARPELDKVITILTENPSLNLAINSHTDSRGDKGYNMWLSQKRAQSVVDYLTRKGIDPKRLVAQGFGESQLTNDCNGAVRCAATDHQSNRRTEFIVTGL